MTDTRAEFESAYIAHLKQQWPLNKCTPQDLAVMRDGDGYGDSASHLTGAWWGWRAAFVSGGDVVAFQARVQPWMLECFGAEVAADTIERNHRFFEEAAELVQACGMTASEAHQLVDYTFGRPVGEPSQEVGGVMVTLAALCLANGLDMRAAGETELARISIPETVAKIRAKQAAKPRHSPLPSAPAQSGGDAEQADEAVTDAASDLAFSVFSGIDALRWLLNITTEFDRKDVRTRQAARLLDDYTDSFGKTNRQRLEDLWKKLNDKLPDDGRINEYLRAHDSASRELKARAKDSK